MFSPEFCTIAAIIAVIAASASVGACIKEHHSGAYRQLRRVLNATLRHEGWKADSLATDLEHEARLPDRVNDDERAVHRKAVDA